MTRIAILLLAAALTACAAPEPIKFAIHTEGGKRILVVETPGACDYRVDTGCAIQWADKVDAVWQIKYSIAATRAHELDHAVHGMKHSEPWVKFEVYGPRGFTTAHCVLVTDPGTSAWKMNELMRADADGYYPSHDGSRK